MADFIGQFVEHAGNDVLTLLVDTRMQADGLPNDPAAWDDWLECVERIKAGKTPRDGQDV